MVENLQQLPDESTIWLFGFGRQLEDTEVARLNEAVSEFLGSWKAHGTPVRAGFEILNMRFLLIASDPASTVSGCALDALFRGVIAIAQSMKLELIDERCVFYLKAGEILCTPRPDFAMLCQDGVIAADSEVIDLTISSLGQYRSGHWRKTFSNSWHARVFSVQQPTA